MPKVECAVLQWGGYRDLDTEPRHLKNATRFQGELYLTAAQEEELAHLMAKGLKPTIVVLSHGWIQEGVAGASTQPTQESANADHSTSENEG